ncbi:MAG: hypothetical protein ACKVYV_08310 [Limisphaerales bacterium]
MSALRCAVAWLAVLLAVAARGDARDDPWFRLSGEHLEILTHGREADARRVFAELETFRIVAEDFLGLTNRARVPVFYFRSEGAARLFRSERAGHAIDAAGFHVAGEGGASLVFHRGDTRSGTLETAFHEYTHLLTQRALGPAPLWLHEGVAIALSTFEVSDGLAKIGRPHPVYGRQVQAFGALPVADLVTVEPAGLDYRDVNASVQFYASAWALTYYLLFTEKGAQAGLLQRLVAEYARTPGRLAAFETVLGRPAADVGIDLQARLRAGNRYTQFSLPVVKADPAAARWERLSDAERDLQLGDLLRLLRQHDEARPLLVRAAAGLRDDPRPHASLGLLLAADSAAAEARVELRRALELGSTNAAAFMRLAALQLGDSPLTASSTPEEAAAAARLLDRSLELDPADPLAHFLRALAALRMNPAAPALAAPHVRAALALAPRYPEARMLNAMLLAAGGQRDDAQRELAALLASPELTGREALRASAQKLAEKLAQGSGSAAPP